MGELNIISSGVLAANSNTVTTTGYSAGSITAGQVLWLNGTATPPVLGTAIGTNQTQAGSVVGIALDNALGSNQLVTYATSGNVILPTIGGTTSLVSGSVYVLSTNVAGSMVAANDVNAPPTGTFVTLIGMAINPNTLLVNITPLSAPR